MFKKLTLIIFSLHIYACDTSPVDDSTNGNTIAQIDLLVLYTQAALDNFPNIETKIDGLVFEANQQYSNSNAKVNLSVVSTAYYDVPNGIIDDVNQDLEFKLIGDPAVQQLRKDVEADLVVLVSKASALACGIAPLGVGNAHTGLQAFNYHLGYSVIGAECTNGAMAHEIGHNLGLHHSPELSNYAGGGVYFYGRGYTLANEFTTIMGYENGIHLRHLRFSSPNDLCTGISGNQSPCGVAPGGQGQADSVSAINNRVAFQVANYSDSDAANQRNIGNQAIRLIDGTDILSNQL